MMRMTKRTASIIVRTALSGSWRRAGRQLHHVTSSRALHFSPFALNRMQSPSSLCSCMHRVQPTANLSSNSGKRNIKTVKITFTDRDGDVHTVKAKLGDTMLEVAKEYDIDLEGACEGTLSCSTCHLIVDPEWFPKIEDPLTEEEEDMLDMAYGLTDTSRLGCQIVVVDALDGLKLTVPSGTSDAREL